MKLTIDGKISFSPSRRNVIKVMGLSPMLAPFVLTPSRAASKRITVRGLSGNLLNGYYIDAIYKPFTQLTGIEIVIVSSEPEPVAQIQMMVETKRYLWDIASLSQKALSNLTAGKYLEKHELEHDPVISAISPRFISPCGVGMFTYSTVLAYRADVFRGRRTPESWRDLWDVNRFPGRRALRGLPFDTVEVALMADGVPAGNVYPCDLDRAFCSLDKIKPHIAVWWKAAGQAEQLLKSNEVDLIPVFNLQAQAATDAGVPIMTSWDLNILGYHSWAILRGTPNAEVCRQLIKFASDPKRQALLAPYGIGLTHSDAFNYIGSKHAKCLPTDPDNLKKGLYVSSSYWLSAYNTAIEQFNNWMLI